MAALCSLALFGALLASSVDGFPLNARAPVNSCFLHPAHLKTPAFRGAFPPSANGTGVPSPFLHNGTRPHGNSTGTGAAYPTSTGSILSANGVLSNSSVLSGYPSDGDCGGMKASDDQVYVMVNGEIKIATLAPPPTSAAAAAKVIPIPANAPQYTYNYTSHSSHIKTTNTTNTTTTTIAYVYVGGKIATAQVAPAPKPVAAGTKSGSKAPITQQVTGTVPAAASADSADSADSASGSDAATVPAGNGQVLTEKPDAPNFVPQGDTSPLGPGSVGAGSSPAVKAPGPGAAKAGSGGKASGLGSKASGPAVKASGPGAAKAGSGGKVTGLKGASSDTDSKAPATQGSALGNAGAVSGAGDAVPLTGGQASGDAASDKGVTSQQASANPSALTDTILATAPDDADTEDAKSDASSDTAIPANKGVSPGTTLSTGQSSSAGNALPADQDASTSAGGALSAGQGTTQPVVPAIQDTTKLAATAKSPAVKPKAAAKAVAQYAAYYQTVYSTSSSEEESSTNSSTLIITPNQTPPLPAQSSIPACGVFVKLNGKTVAASLAPVPAATNGSTIKIAPDNVFVKANGQVQALPLAEPPANIASINNPPKKQPANALGVEAVTGLSSTTTTTDDKTCFVSIYGTLRKAPLAPKPAAQGTSKIPLVVLVPASADNSFKQTSTGSQSGDGDDLAYVYYQGLVVIASLALAPGTVPVAPLPTLNATTGLNDTSARANVTGKLSSFLDTTKNIALNESTLQTGSVLSFSSPKNITNGSIKLSAANDTAAAGTATPTGAISPPVFAPLGGLDAVTPASPVLPASTGTLGTQPASNGTLFTAPDRVAAIEKSGIALSEGAPIAPPFNPGFNTSSTSPGPTAAAAMEYPIDPAETSTPSTTSSSAITSPTLPSVIQSELSPAPFAGSPTNATSNSTSIAPGTAAPAPVVEEDTAPARDLSLPDADTAPAQQAAAAAQPLTGTTAQPAPVVDSTPGYVKSAAKAAEAAKPETAAASTQGQAAAAGEAASSGAAPASADVQKADAASASDAKQATPLAGEP